MYPVIPAHRKELMQKIILGGPDFHAAATAMHFLDCHMQPEKLDVALRWLVRNMLCGRSFYEFFAGICRSSNLELLRYLTMRVERETELRRLYIGKDVQG